MKKTMSFVLTLIMALSFVLSFPVTSLAAGDKYVTGQLSDTSRSDGGTVYWELNYNTSSKTASLKITGEGYLPNDQVNESWHSVLPNDCFLTSVSIGEGVKSLMNNAFSGEAKLKSIKLPESLEIIGANAFAGTGIKTINIPANVQNIILSQFDPTVIENINVSAENPYYNSVDGVVYSEDGTELVAFPTGRYNKEGYSFTIPENVVSIGSYAFYNCLMTELTIPDTVLNIGAFAFAGNVDLRKVNLGRNLRVIGESAFLSCESLREIYIPESVQRIGYNSFGAVYKIYFEGIEEVFADAGVSMGPVNENTYDIFMDAQLQSLGYTIEMFVGVEYDTLFNIYAPAGSVGERHANRIGFDFTATSCHSAAILKAESVYNGVRLVWSRSVDADGYVLERQNSLGQWKEIYRTDDSYEVSFLDKNAEYSINKYRVIAFNEKGEGIEIQKEYKIRHYQVAVPKTIKNTLTGIEFTFTSGETAKKYYIFRKAQGDSEFKQIGIVYDDSFTYLDKKVSNGRTYTYTVKGYDGEDFCSYDPVGLSKTFIEAPEISVTNSVGGVTVKWESNDKATSYSIYRRTATTKSVLYATADADDTSFIDKKVKSGDKYKYYVKANIGKEQSECYSDSDQNIIFLTTPKVKAASKTNGVTVTWNKVSGAKGYYVYRKVPGSGWKKIYTVKSGKTVSYTDKSVKNRNKYEYTVRAVNGSFSSYYQKPGPQVFYITTPKLKSVSSSRSGCKITYSTVSGCDGYYIYRRTTNCSWSHIGTVKGSKKSSYTDKKAKKGKTYIYTVRAYDGKYRSAYYSGLKIKDRY